MKRGVDVVISNNQGKILILKRNSDELHYPNLWDLPGGKVEDSESLQEAAVRETKEECGLNIKIEKNYFYVYCCKDKQFNIYGFKAKLVNGDILLSEEHTDFKWILKDDRENLEYTPSVKKTIEEFFK